MALGNGGSAAAVVLNEHKKALLLQCSLFAVLGCLLSGCGKGLPSGAFECDSSGKQFTKLMHMDKKGLALDDNTFRGCANKVPYFWPNTHERVTSIRLFTPWRADFGDDKAREATWANILSFLTKSGAQVLVGTDATCDAAGDDAQWKHTLEFLKRLRAAKVPIQGVAIGNEMDIMSVHGAPEECLHKLWDLGDFKKTVTERVKDLDDNGFPHVPVTTVWSAGVLGGDPFKPRILPFMEAMNKQYSKRWVWSATVYAIWNLGLMPQDCDRVWDPRMKGECMATCKDRIDLIANMARYNSFQVADFRARIRKVTGREDSIFWVAETGWSSPVPKSIATVPHCKDYTSMETFAKYYSSFLAWNLDTVKGSDGKVERGPDHIFYFTVRDSANFEDAEHFGLVESCEETKCKIRSSVGAADGSALEEYTSEVTV